MCIHVISKKACAHISRNMTVRMHINAGLNINTNNMQHCKLTYSVLRNIDTAINADTHIHVHGTVNLNTNHI